MLIAFVATALLCPASHIHAAAKQAPYLLRFCLGGKRQTVPWPRGLSAVRGLSGPLRTRRESLADDLLHSTPSFPPREV